LTFQQELIKEAVGALATALLVALLATIAENEWSKRRDQRAAKFTVCTALLERASLVAQEMYTCCGHTMRLKERNQRSSDDELDALDQEYFTFTPKSGALEHELGARYGFEDVLIEAGSSSRNGSRVRERWHQINDLLTVYYWKLRYPDDLKNVFERNSLGQMDDFTQAWT